MALLNSNELVKNISNVIHQDTQKQDLCLDLTLSEIYTFTGAGSLDFGGSEFEEASAEKIKPQKKDPDDKYGWWKLEGGVYQAVCNESFKPTENCALIIVPHVHAQKAGVMVNPVVAERDPDDSSIRLLIHVPKPGCNIKENARFASAYLVESKHG